MDESTLFALMMDLHREGMRQGPGSDEATAQALELTRLERSSPLEVADIGCGTGASTLVLAKNLPHARIIAVDLIPEFLQVLAERVRAAGFGDRIQTLATSMETLPFPPESLDLIWSEGAIYNMGFRAGVEAWRPLLRSGGVIAVSEITWLRPDPPEDVRQHWTSEYAEIATATDKIAVLQHAGYDLLGYFVLPSSNWIENYYRPTAQRMPAFLERHQDDPNAAEIAEMERHEADLYERYQDSFGYGFYIARKR